MRLWVFAQNLLRLPSAARTSNCRVYIFLAWKHHTMGILAALLALCKGNLWTPMGSPHRGSVNLVFAVYVAVCLIKQLNKQSHCRCHEPLRRSCDITVIALLWCVWTKHQGICSWPPSPFCVQWSTRNDYLTNNRTFLFYQCETHGYGIKPAYYHTRWLFVSLGYQQPY